MRTKIKYFSSREEFVMEAMVFNKLRKVLDVGFIGSYQEAWMHYKIVDELGKQDRLVGIDVDKKGMKRFLAKKQTQARVADKKLQYKIASVFETGMAAGQFTQVMMLEVFEHLRSPYLALNEVRRVLVVGGSLIMTYPNPLSMHKLYLMLRLGDELGKSEVELFRGDSDHRVFPHPLTMMNYLGDMGFGIKTLAFAKNSTLKRLPGLGEKLSGLRHVRQFSDYVGIHAVLEKRV